MKDKDSERIYHIERKVDEILSILKGEGYVCPGPEHPKSPTPFWLYAETPPYEGDKAIPVLPQ